MGCGKAARQERRARRGAFAAWYALISVPVVLFTFAGVNTLMHGLHTYG